MRRVRQWALGGLGIAIGLALAAPSAAATNISYSFNTSNSNLTLATTTGAGNTMTFQSQVNQSAVLTMNATAWNANLITTGNDTGKYAITQATLAEYAGGLGVTSKYDDLTRSGCGIAECSTHQIDNFGNGNNSFSVDFIRLDFNYAVTLGSIKQSAFASYDPNEIQRNVYDDDFSYGKAAFNAVSDGKILSTTDFGAIFGTNINNNPNVNGGQCSVTSWTSNGVNLTGCNDTRVLANAADVDGTGASKTWYIAASLLKYGNDGNPDSFKLANVTAIYTLVPNGQGAVPEPSTWMTMIAGFGVAGFAMRRARRNATVTA